MHEPPLPRSHWNDQVTRHRDLEEARKLLDLEERCWNAMVAYWRKADPSRVPLPSPAFTQTERVEVISHFP